MANKNPIEKLDSIDLKILKILQEDGKITNLQLSKDIGLSPAPTLERVKKLESSGFVKSYHALVDEKMLNIGITAFMQIYVNAQSGLNDKNFSKEIEKIPEIVECYQVTGNADYLLKIMVCDMSAFDLLVRERLSRIQSIRQMQTMVVISTEKNKKVLPYHYGK